jgi:phenylpropionate dioxygenase-like ring-hydroxylating dioxygenase large terminal subunit
VTSFADNPVLRSYWYPIALERSLDDGPVAAELLGQKLVAWRTEEGVGVLPDRCPHREAPLSAGSVCDGRIVCGYHGWSFAPDGTCVDVPSQRARIPVPPAAHIEPVRVVLRYGLVWVCLGEPAAGIVDVPESLDPSYRRINCSFEVWNASASRLMDNFVDYSHFPFTHGGSFGAVMDAIVPTIEIERRDDLHSFSFRFEAANPSLARTTTQVEVDTLTRTMTHAYAMPFTVRNVIAYDNGLRHVVLIQLTPVDDLRTLFTMTIFRNDDHAVPAHDAVALDRVVVDEDRRMLEAIPGPLPLDPRSLAQVQADRPSVDWARRFARLLEPSH